MVLTKIMIDFSNDHCSDIVANSTQFMDFSENCLTQIFMNGTFHKPTIEANDIIFFSLSMVTNTLFLVSSRQLREVFIQVRPVLFDLFLGRYDRWSRSVFEAFCVLLHMHDSENVIAGYTSLPRYRVLKEYNEKGITELLGPEAGGPWVKDDFIEVLDRIVSLKHIANPDIQAMIDNYSQSESTIY